MKFEFDMNNEQTQRKIGIMAVILGIILIVGIGLYFFFSYQIALIRQNKLTRRNGKH